jgi:PhnB protein
VSVALNPYLSFRDNAREAMEFYRSVFGGKLDLSTFADFGASDDPDVRDKIMHGHLDVGDGLTLMGADTPPGMPYSGQSGVAISLSGSSTDDAPRLRGWFDALAEGGAVHEPLVPAPWGDVFGMCTDRFGTSWMVNFPAGTA